MKWHFSALRVQYAGHEAGLALSVADNLPKRKCSTMVPAFVRHWLNSIKILKISATHWRDSLELLTNKGRPEMRCSVLDRQGL